MTVGKPARHEQKICANAASEPVDQYLRSFHWNKVKYRADKPLGELIDMLQKVMTDS